MRQIIIERATQNEGFMVRDIASGLSEEGNDWRNEETHTISEDDPREAMTALLNLVADLYDEGYDKYAKDNLNISWDRKGHKYE